MADHGPLHGIKVVDMTEALAGPYCAMLLGDLGADIVKVERPGVGDQARTWGPPFLEGESAYFLGVNRNKRSVELDSKNPTDSDLLKRLIARADVFLTNNPRIDSLARSGLDPATLRRRDPRLIYAAVSGYGHFGPKANRGGYDIIAQGEAALATRCPRQLRGEHGGEQGAVVQVRRLGQRPGLLEQLDALLVGRAGDAEEATIGGECGRDDEVGPVTVAGEFRGAEQRGPGVGMAGQPHGLAAVDEQFRAPLQGRRGDVLHQLQEPLVPGDRLLVREP